MLRRLVWMVLVVGCTKKNPDYCAADADCDDPTRPFCDVAGEYPESGKQANHCSVVPANCPLDRCGCTPGAGLSCAGDQLTSCSADGQSTTTSSCALGCATDARCLTFEPSNGLGPALREAAGLPDVVFPRGITIDTDLGLVRDSNGTPIAVHTETVTQGGSTIRVFVARSFVIDDAVASGSAALAFVASGNVSIIGKLDVSARGLEGGAGSQLAAPCVGGYAQVVTFGGTNSFANGEGGAGNATAGGQGGGFNGTAGSLGGMSSSSFEPLLGGCRGGKLLAADGSLLVSGGGGGGAVQVVSAAGIMLTSRGFVSAGGGGGGTPSGGGSGGVVVFEAATVDLNGATVGIATNGGSGGCSNAHGADANLDDTPAHVSACQGGSAGDGGCVSTPPQTGYVCVQNCVLLGNAQGGGGAIGRARIATRTGDFAAIDGARTTTQIVKGQLVPQ